MKEINDLILKREKQKEPNKRVYTMVTTIK